MRNIHEKLYEILASGSGGYVVLNNVAIYMGKSIVQESKVNLSTNKTATFARFVFLTRFQ